MKRFLLIIIFIPLFSFSQDEERNYFPINEFKVQKYYFINHQNSVTCEVISYLNDIAILKEKIYIGNLPPLENISRYKFIEKEYRILSVDTTIKLPDYKPLNVPGVVMKFPVEFGKKWEFEYNGIKYKREIVKRHREMIFDEKSFQDVLEIKQIAYDVNDVRTTYEYYCYGIGLIKTEALVKNSRITVLSISSIDIKIDSSILMNTNDNIPEAVLRASEEFENESEFSSTQSAEGKENILISPEELLQEGRKVEPAEPEQPQAEDKKKEELKPEEKKPEETQAEDKKKNVPTPENP